MRKPIIWSFSAVLLVILVGWIFWQLLELREPAYQGKPLSFWLDQHKKNSMFPDLPDRIEADNAIRSIGNNALPVLVRWTAVKDSTFKKKLIVLMRKQSLIQFPFHSDEEYHALADAGFAALGPLAKPAVPELIKLLNHPDPWVRVAAGYDLMWIGPEAQDAIPALITCLNDSNGMVRFRATRCLCAIHMKPELVVPALARSLEQSSVPPSETISALVQYGEDAKPAVPQLVRLLNSKDLRTRLTASNALHRIDPGMTIPSITPDESFLE